MDGIVLVSHGRTLAASLVDLVSQVSNAKIPIVFAAGTGIDR